MQMQKRKTLLQCILAPFQRVGSKILLHIPLLMFLLSSCDKADNFYQELYDKPEIMELSYKTTYEVGDTFALYGRLHIDKGVTLHIGDVDAKLVYQGYDEINKTELIKTLITAGMGAGNNRPVTITAGNAVLEAPPINIYSSAGAGYLQDTLALESYLKLPASVVFLNCLSGNGNVYYWAATEKKMYVAKPEGSTKMLLLASGLSDESGVYTVSTFYSGAVDPDERLLYFSALTTDNSADNARNFIYRLCRFDLLTGKLTTLNRTLVRKGTVQAIPAELPLEGKIGEVKLLGIGQMYPDK